MSTNRYSLEYKENILNQLKSGVHPDEICKENQVSKRTLSRWMQEANIKIGYGYKDELRNEVLEKFKSGESKNDLALKYNICVGSINRWLLLENGPIVVNKRINTKLKSEEADFFWDTMKKCDWSTEGDGDYDKIVIPVIEYLSELDDSKIFEFDTAMTTLLYKLDSKMLFNKYKMVKGDSSKERFLYARCVALFNGDNYYKKVLAGKNLGVWELELKSILSVPSKAYALKHNKDITSYPFSNEFSYETGSNKALW